MVEVCVTLGSSYMLLHIWRRRQGAVITFIVEVFPLLLEHIAFPRSLDQPLSPNALATLLAIADVYAESYGDFGLQCATLSSCHPDHLVLR